jgi:HTH-type transcriptional regulator/antitoxin HigA
VWNVATTKANELSTGYLNLIRRFPLRPIRTEAELDRAIAIIDRLAARARPLSAAEQDYFECLSHEIERYEATAHPMPAVSLGDLLNHLMDARSVVLSEVARDTDIAAGTLAALVKGKREPTLQQVKALAAYFHVEPAVFLD